MVADRGSRTDTTPGQGKIRPYRKRAACGGSRSSGHSSGWSSIREDQAQQGVQGMRLDFSEQHPIWKAGFFLQRAEECSADELAAFEAYLQAAIVFGRSAIQWTQRKHEDKSNPEWQKWWKSLLKDPSIKFFKDYRDDLLHERPRKLIRGSRCTVTIRRQRGRPSFTTLRTAKHRRRKLCVVT